MGHAKAGPFTNGAAPALNAGTMDILDSQYDDAMADAAVLYGNDVRAWAPNTPYIAGQAVVSPTTGDVVTAKTNHTSGSTYSGTGAGGNWNLSATFEPAGLSSSTTATLDLRYRKAIIADAATYGNGTTDATSYLNSLFSSAQTFALDVILPPGTYKCTGTLTWNPSKYSVRAGGNVFLDFTTATSGPALTVTKTPGETGYFQGLAEHSFEGIKLVGPNTDAATVDGLYVNDTVGAFMVTFRNVNFYGFRNNVTVGANNWLLKFYDCAFSNAHTANLYLAPGTNAGENYSFYGCVINNAHNAAGTAYGLWTVGNPDAYFYGCSFDYNDTEIYHTGGKVSIHGGHIEDGRASGGYYGGGPMIKCKWFSGQNRTILNLTGVEVSPTESNAGTIGRDHLVENTSDSGDNVYITCVGVTWDTYNNGAMIFKNMATGTNPMFKNIGGTWDPGSVSGDRASVLSGASNLLANGDFESSSTFLASSSAPFYPGRDWAHGGTVTYAFDTTHQHSGSRCASIVGPAGNSVTSSIQNSFTVKPGDQITVTCWVNIAAYTSGSIQPRVSWYLADYTTRTVVAWNPATLTAATAGYVALTTKLTVPPGITVAMFDVQTVNFIGTAYLDDVIVNTNS